MRNFILALLGLLIINSCTTSIKQENNIVDTDALRKGFATPPREARPRALWDWVDGNFSLDEITYEMEEAAAKGMGGFDIWDVRSVVDEDSIMPVGPSFMSDEYMEGIVHAIKEAKRLDLDLGIIIASGWNAGGQWTKPEHQTMGLFESEILVEGPAKISQRISFPELPDQSGKKGRERKSIIPKGEDGLPQFYTEVSVLAIPEVEDSSLISLDKVLNISENMDEEGNLKWDAPKGKWRVIRYVCTNTGQPMISCTPNSVGPMIDHFNPDATERHINYFIDRVEEKMGMPIKETGLSYLYTDSYEVKGLLWTPRLIEEFRKRMGYSMVNYIPALQGYVIESSDITRRFLYDYRKVWSDLIIEGHYQKATEICESHGIGFVAEAAGPGWPIHNCPFESLKSSGIMSFPRGEFWHLPTKTQFWLDRMAERKHHYEHDLQVIKGVACASHIYNQKYVEAEAFTGTHLWHEGPGDLKPTADRAFCEGLNRINFHTWPHTPKEAGEPGWAYSFGTLIHETRVWWPMAKPWMDYLGRCSYLLQQGNFQGDVLYYYGDSAPNFVPPKYINPSLGYGYDYDVTNSDVLLNKISVHNGKLVLPHGQSYEMLVLPDEEYMVLEILEKIEQLVEAGATVVGPKPLRSHGLKDWQEHDKNVVELASKLWGNCDGNTVTENTYGNGKIVWGKSLKEIMDEKKVIPDFDFVGNINKSKVDFIHRKMDGAEIYFVRNSTDKHIQGDALFRVTGMYPEIWDPISGNMNQSKVFFPEQNKTIVPITLEPFGSVFVVFTQKENTQYYTRILLDDTQVFPLHGIEAIKGRPIGQCKGSAFPQLVFKKAGKYTLQLSQGENTILDIGKSPEPFLLEGTWELSFPEDKKGIGKTTFDSLYSWALSDVKDIHFFSGIAIYEKSFELPSDLDTEKYKAVLKLGTVKEVANLFVNGEHAGICWDHQYRKDISSLLQPGKNTLKIEVANTWHNRLCGDAKLPKEERITSSNIIRLPNPWSIPMKDIPFDNGDEKYDLLESGLIGPVEIMFVEKIDFVN